LKETPGFPLNVTQMKVSPLPCSKQKGGGPGTCGLWRQWEDVSKVQGPPYQKREKNHYSKEGGRQSIEGGGGKDKATQGKNAFHVGHGRKILSNCRGQ